MSKRNLLASLLVARKSDDASAPNGFTWQKVGIAEFWQGAGYTFPGSLVSASEWDELEKAAKYLVWGDESATGAFLEEVDGAPALRIDLM
tara:strand:- start:796 stop:1065 length:270 start_codon:yes stop_codon:yes gene_type:complete